MGGPDVIRPAARCAGVVVLQLACMATGWCLDETRLSDVPDAAAWHGYLARSRTLAAADRDALAADVKAAGLAAATKAPNGGDFRPPDADEREWYAGDEAQRLADAVISFQTPSGGWSKHTAYSKGPRRPGMQWTSQSEPGRPPHYQATFDNAATVREIEFLASVWRATGRDDCRAAAQRGFEFILAAQYPNGGWPQGFPLEGGYHDLITFNDDSMTNILVLLRAGTSDDPRYAFVDADLRNRLRSALDRGVACVLAAQVEVDGRATVWCAQHDPLTLAPAAARAFEPPALSGVESAHVLRFLMSLEEPSAGVIAAIEAGLAWLEGATVTGVSRIERDGRTIYAKDPASTERYWARFYDLATSEPLFPGKNGIVYASFEEMAAANDKLGYDYYSTRPGSILRNGQKKWRKKLEAAR
jgi:PelA/Pel-15E family pectate lyase